MVNITFEHNYDTYPEITEGPFEWIEMVGGNMFGLRPGENEAGEIAGLNTDCTWDAGPFQADELSQRKKRHYTRWTIGEWSSP